MKSAIIFGINGQDGFYLNKILQKKNIIVIGVSRSRRPSISGDILDRYFVESLIKDKQPDFVFHLAANSTTRHDAMFENHDTISTGSLNILEAVYKFSKHTKIFISGSGLQFLNKGLPISEKNPFEANDPYSVSRIQSVYAARYFRKLGVQTYVGYFFNHDSPLRSEKHVNQKIVKAVNRISSGANEIIELGDISVRKEFSFAGDIVDAIFMLVNNDKVFETVIGSGIAYTIEEWLTICFRYYGLDWQKHIKIKTDYIADYKTLVSDPYTLFSLGWNPLVDFESLAKMMLKFK